MERTRNYVFLRRMLSTVIHHPLGNDAKEDKTFGNHSKDFPSQSKGGTGNYCNIGSGAVPSSAIPWHRSSDLRISTSLMSFQRRWMSDIQSYSSSSMTLSPNTNEIWRTSRRCSRPSVAVKRPFRPVGLLRPKPRIFQVNPRVEVGEPYFREETGQIY
ncbi:hypothetical protein Tsubulata_038943 [Turnera subulata]|uniref:Uncharacterized protein n=1 Tax=Turnera subulata TaxID=218843 RepID=A0A9Q0FT00_9ROSI|nr:hypothetical protein Tsubulata_038943 [Turnera subulata]